MEAEQMEQQAVLLCGRAQGKRYRYEGDLLYYKGQTGSFQVAYDQNCCAPTQAVLFAFRSDTTQHLMGAEEFLTFYGQCIPLETKAD